MTNTLSRRHLLGAAAGTAFGLPGLSALAQTASSRPNLILYFPDEMRADALGCYGNPIVKTPNFDRLAKDGARFENCHVQYPVCGASRCSMLTGWPMSVRGHRTLTYFLRPYEPNMFRYLREAGYDVFWFGKNDALAADSFKDSVTEWAQANQIVNILAQDTPTGPFTMLVKGGADRRKTPDYAMLQRAIKVLERREKTRPFCIFLPLSQPHPPYGAPADFNTMYKPGDVPPLVPPGLPKAPTFRTTIRHSYGLDTVSDSELRQVRATYYGQVSYSDWLLGELLEALERTGHAQNTAIISSSDHGDYAGDYGLVEKWPSDLASCLTHVPLIARVPGANPGVTGRNMVELYDIMATFLELAGTKARHTNFARSLLPQIHGDAGDPDRAAFSEGGANIYEAEKLQVGGLYAAKSKALTEHPEADRNSASVKTTRFTYITRPTGQNELYDRQSDPHEEHNLADDRSMAGTRSAMERKLLDWYINTTGVPEQDHDPRDLPPFDPPDHLNVDPAAMARILDQ